MGETGRQLFQLEVIPSAMADGQITYWRNLTREAVIQQFGHFAAMIRYRGFRSAEYRRDDQIQVLSRQLCQSCGNPTGFWRGGDDMRCERCAPIGAEESA